MVKYACFIFATLVFLTLTDFIAAQHLEEGFVRTEFNDAEYVARADRISVNEVNRWYPGVITANVDGNSSAKASLSQLNLWDILKPLLDQEGVVDSGLLKPSQLTKPLYDIFYKYFFDTEMPFMERNAIMELIEVALKTLRNASDDATAMSLLVDVDLWSVLMEDLVKHCL